MITIPSEERGSFVRGWVLTACMVFGPLGVLASLLAVGEALGVHAFMALGFGGALTWLGILIPYWWLHPKLLSPAAGFVVAACQWLLAAFLLGVWTRDASLPRAMLWIAGRVTAVGTLVWMTLAAFGYRVEFF